MVGHDHARFQQLEAPLRIEQRRRAFMVDDAEVRQKTRRHLHRDVGRLLHEMLTAFGHHRRTGCAGAGMQAVLDQRCAGAQAVGHDEVYRGQSDRKGSIRVAGEIGIHPEGHDVLAG